MENSNQTNNPQNEVSPSALEKLLSSVALRILIMFILLLLLLIPMNWVNELIVERSDRQRTVTAEIASKWGEAQVVSGPVLCIPYLFNKIINTTDDKGKPKVETSYEKDYLFLAARICQFTLKLIHVC
ncbi:inner membrane CreD family protein [Sphingobacterium sp. LRF_L2]|uniref:inner membrane CreD family protein n=1 Tax=Sphingobacterium sp. LRF_L2 TaxID=3369421 RepID=UPI003F5EBA55